MRVMGSMILTWVLTGCATLRSTPETVLADYLEAEQAHRYEQAHALLTEADRRASPLDDYVADHLSAGPVWLATSRKASFRVEQATPRGEDAVDIRVSSRHVDPNALLDAIGPPVGLDRSPDPEKAWYEHATLALESRDFPQIEESLTYGLRREDGAWRVWLGIASQEEAGRLWQVVKDATAAGDKPAAVAGLRAILALEPDPGGLVDGIQAESRRLLEAWGERPTPSTAADGTPSP